MLLLLANFLEVTMDGVGRRETVVGWLTVILRNEDEEPEATAAERPENL